MSGNGAQGAALARDAAALQRDRAADERDRAAELRDELAGRRDIAAARDRAASARDRAAAARDRTDATAEGDAAARELAMAAMDELTWTTRRGPGLLDLEREIERAERTGDTLSIAYLDVDGLKRVNDTDGHAAGDQLLMHVADSLRTELRAYDVVVRMGGDEFLCILSGADEGFVRERFVGIVRRLEERSPAGSFSVGFAEFEAGDSGEQLIARADGELLATRTGNGVAR